MRNEMTKYQIATKQLLRSLLLLAVMMVTGVEGAWGQTDPYEGTWYITNGSNYYLCPALGYYQGNFDTPYITTYQTGKDKNSIWRIEKVEDGSDVYYRFIHNLTGKYLTANDAPDASNPARMRIHLEEYTVSVAEATLFIIVPHTSNNGKIAIRSKSYSDADNDRYWFDISNGNKNNYWNGNFDGSLGFWQSLANSNNGAVWTLETASQTCATPVITYNETDNTFSISYPGDNTGVSIHYTIDGTEPTSSSATYDSPIAEANVTIKLRAIAVKDDYNNSDEAMVYGAAYSATPHFFKTIDTANQSYYMISPTDDDDATESRQYVTTSNVPNSRMQWLVKPATVNNGVQYYYIVNYETGKYIYFRENAMDKNSVLIMKAKDEEGTEPDRFMFRLWDMGGYFNISPKMFSNYIPAQNQKNMLYKQNATDHTNPIGIHQPDNGGRARWQMIDVPADPKSLSTLPSEMVSSLSAPVYFKLRNAAQTNGADYFLTPPTTAQGAATTATTSDNQEWYLLPADDTDTWCTYYYLRNAATGRYLYFDGVSYNANENKFFVSKEIVTGSEDKYKFLVLKTASTTYSGTYHIVPKLIHNNNNQGQIGLGRKDKSTPLQTQDSRNNGKACWYLDAVNDYVASPIITYNANDNTISLSCTTPGVTIYYTTDGSDPTTSSNSGTSFALPDDCNTVKAIAMKDGVSSTVATYTVVVHASVGTTKRIYYIQSVASTDFYLIPGDTNNGNLRVNTLSMPRPSMQWYFQDAGIENDIQYYYIVNAYADNDESASTLGYLYRNGNEANVKSTLDTSDDNYKFAIETNASGGYNIVAKNQPNYCLQKNDGNHNNATNPVATNGARTNAHSRWNFVTTQPALTAPVTLSTAGNTIYYTIGNVGQTGYIAPPTATNVILEETEDNNQSWYFLSAGSDDWVSYYYIVHANTGQYMYFSGTTNNDGFNITQKEFIASDADRYKFAIAPTVTEGQYYIVPQTYRYVYNNQYYCLYKKDQLQLKTSAYRGDNRSKWTFDEYAFKCAAPSFQYVLGKLTITCATEGSKIYYATEGNEPTISDACLYTGPVTIEGESPVVKAFAIRNNDGSDQSEMATFTLQVISSGDEITNMSGTYTLASNFTPSDTPIGTKDNPFRGTIDGQLNKFNISHPMFYYVENATIKNVILDNVTITSGITSDDDDNGNTGAIACVAKGTTRIYNCGILATSSTVSTDDDGYTHITNNSSTVSGSNYVGGLVGLLDDEARVINCFSYANITGGSYVGGIVGYNNVATTSQNLKTMVMNCMFYGDITGGTNKAPIYNGTIITNVKDNSKTGVGNYNYFCADASYVKNRYINTYNCALLAETRFLQRFEFFRLMLNSNRELAAWWATGDASNKDVMMKWVMEPSQIGSTTPYPILKTPGRYHSIVNIDMFDVESRRSNSIGNKLGSSLTVNVQMGDGKVYEHPGTGDDEAKITTSSLILDITDKDPEHFNFNYGKVQLPYYNDVGTKNYTDNRVVTGWKIVEINGSSTGTGAFSTGSDVTIDGETITMPYNFADRSSTKKDLYSQSGRIFNQGAYWDVPEGVTSITLQPYWAKAAYCGDQYWDVVFTSDMGTRQVVETTGGGKRFDDNTNKSIAGSSQKVYTTIAGAQEALFSGIADATATGYSVYDNAVVLIGNCRQYNGVNGDEKRPFTIMSIDLDNDNEPDYSLALRFDGRTVFHPARYDFLNFIGLGMAQKSAGSTGSYNFGIAQPKWWFEITNTSTFRVTQFEYDIAERAAKPIIIHGGVFEQWVAGQTNSPGNKTTYFHIGSNVWFKEFQLGVHQDNDGTCLHSPISITGGDYGSLHLTNLYKAITNYREDNAECYLNGGRFGEVAGAGMEGIGKANGADNTGNIFWQIDNADIREFYGGGINAQKPVRGNIRTIISNSKVGLFCGGPKFGDMSTGKTVITKATNCEFGTFFGAGYGGTSYSRFAPKNYDSMGANTTWRWGNMDWNSWVNGTTSKDNYGGYKQEYNSGRGGVSTRIDYQFLPMSNNNTNVMRIFLDYASFSLATTHNVTSTLTGCTITDNFYGGGSLGKVNGPVTSTLTNCTVNGSVYGAGYSASIPTVEVMNTGGFPTPPYYDSNLGIYLAPVFPETVTYTWEYSATKVTNDATAIDKENHILYTNEELTTLGTVTGDVTLTITGTDTYIGGNVYGGGDESSVGGNTTVSIDAGKTLGSVYGGGNIGSVGTFTKANAAYHTAHSEVPVGKPITHTSGGKTTVTISGTAEIGHDGMSMTAVGGPSDFGHIFGAGRGTTDPLYNDPDYKDKPITDAGKQAKIAELADDDELQAKLDELETLAYVNETEVTISGTAFVKGSVYGGSENGHVLGDTWVKINGGQIGCGKNTTKPFPEEKFAAGYELQDDEDMECASWDYTYPYRPHDIFAGVYGYDSRGGYTTASNGHTFYGNVFGGGSGYYPYAPGKWLRTAGRVEGNTKVEVTGGHILTNIYGGNEMTDVGNGLSIEENKGKCEIIMSGGTLGVPRTVSQIQAHPVTCNVFGAGKGDQRTFFNDWTNVSNTEVTIKGTARIYGSVFGGGEDGHVLGNVKVTIEGVIKTTGEGDDAVTETDAPTIGTWGTSYVDGNIFGGGRGFGGDALTAGGVCGNVQIDIKDGTMLGSIYGGGRLGSVGTYLVPPTLSDDTTVNPKYGEEIPDGKQQIVEGDDKYEPTDAADVTHGHININISGGTIGNDHEYTYYAPDATIDKVANNIPLTEFDYRNHVLYTKGGNVFAGCMGRLNGLDGELLPHWKDMAKAKTTTLTITGGTIKSNVYGGGELGTLSGSATINITGGSVGTKVGTGETAYYYGSVYGGGKGSKDSRDAANIHIAGQVGGDVTVNLNNGLEHTDKGGIVHQIFGCNDMNGSPKGSVTVNIYKTQNAEATQIADTEEELTTEKQKAKRKNHYDVEAVYGGGNLAAYVPTATDAKANVNIYGCDETSIRQVYGGGNAASVPATAVEINGSFEIEEAFGGGNGKDRLPDGSVNPGANVGYSDYSAYENSTNASNGAATKELRVANYAYGSGAANMNIHGGTVYRVYGGSNTKGNVRISAVTMLEEAGCDFSVGEAYGGGKSAPMDAEAKLMMACIPGLSAAYGGAMDAEIEGNVELTITNGNYDRVFGGNNVAGFIHGTIQVNIEETGCKPVIIGQLYGGGNQAPYEAPWIDDSDHSKGRQDGPTLNVRSFTSIGEVYGGGYGQSAKVTGDTHVNINVCEGDHKDGFSYADGSTTAAKTGDRILSFTEYKRTYNTLTGSWDFVDENADGERDTETKSVSVYLPPHSAGSIGGINKVYGGGNAAAVDGNTYVNIGTEIGNSVIFKTPLTKSVTTGDGDEAITTEEDTTDADRTHTVKGVDIRGNVFGGGNNAEVQGDTNVVIGKNINE